MARIDPFIITELIEDDFLARYTTAERGGDTESWRELQRQRDRELENGRERERERRVTECLCSVP
jgi:hypothetical protein